jgi:hypothetical protein
MPELRAPEKRRTGIEIKPKVKYPDQTEAAIVHSSVFARRILPNCSGWTSDRSTHNTHRVAV